MKPTLLVLAAGIGRRFGSLKQIEKFGPSGETIIDYSIYDAIRTGFGKVIFVIRRNIEKEFKEIIINKFSDKIKTDYVLQEIDILPSNMKAPTNRKKPWGTGHAVMIAESLIHEPFAVINADDFYGLESFKVVSEYLAIPENNNNTKCCIVGYKLKNTLSEFGSVSRGVCSIDKNSFLTSITERSYISVKGDNIFYKNKDGKENTLSGNEIVSMNLMGLTPPLFKHFNKYFRLFLETNYEDPDAEFHLPSLINIIVKENIAKVNILNTSEKWFGVTYKEDKLNAVKKLQELISAGIYPENLWK